MIKDFACRLSATPFIVALMRFPAVAGLTRDELNKPTIVSNAFHWNDNEPKT